jgi:hypothetical protein
MHFYIDANRGCGAGHMFLVMNGVFAGKSESDDLEEQQTLKLTTTQLEDALMAGIVIFVDSLINSSLTLYNCMHVLIDNRTISCA